MTQRRLHFVLGFAVTIPTLALGWYFVLVQQQFLPFLILCVAYIILITCGSLFLRSRVSPLQRIRPAPPPEIAAIRVGLRAESLAPIVAHMRLTNTTTIQCLPCFRPQRHDLYEASHDFTNGTWTWWVEIAQAKIVAYAVSYKSHHSPTLDTGWTEGKGRTEFFKASA